MHEVIFVKKLEFDGQTWKPFYPITVPKVTLSTSDTTVYDVPEGEIAVVTLIIRNPNAAAETVTIKDGSNELLTVDLSANETKTIEGLVFKDSIVAAAGTTSAEVTIVGKVSRDLE